MIRKQSPFLVFPREKWANFRDSEPLTLTEDELVKLQGIDEELSIDEVKKIYLPLSRLLYYYVNARTTRHAVLMKFLNYEQPQPPFIIGIAGSVSVGKSTTARVLQALLSRWEKDTKVDLVTTDGFLHPNKVLTKKGLMLKKGFPESYDAQRLLQFVIDLKSGEPNIKVPAYSHLHYDIIPNEYTIINQPDILILEGLNVLQSSIDLAIERPRTVVSDYLDFSIYVDADEDLLEHWYVSRFMKFRKGAFSDPNSYFNTFATLTDTEADSTAKSIWREINKVNLQTNIAPTRGRASLILHKGVNHEVDYVKLRK